MKTVVALFLSLAFIVPAHAEADRQFNALAGGVILGAGSYYMATAARVSRRHASSIQQEGQRLLDSKQDAFGLTYQQRADNMFGSAAYIRKTARRERLIAVSLGIAGAVSFSYGIVVTFADRGVQVNKIVRF